MASIRSNGHSVSSTYYDLTALRHRIATCFQQFRKKFVHRSDSQQTYCQHSHTNHYKERSFVKSLNQKLKQVLSPTKNLPRFQKSQRRGQQVIIVTKLLSSTLFATAHITATTTRTTTTTATLQCGAAAVIKAKESTAASGESRKMTIVDDTILTVRDEYPDLDSEVRGILMARAQDGATISQIREDYRKNTGMHFPIYEKITNYLLTIPSVGAVCSPRGTLIFNILPTEKTKHLYDLVLEQKPLQANNARWSVNRGNRQSGNGVSRHALSWRSNIYRRIDYSGAANGIYRPDAYRENREQQQQVTDERVSDGEQNWTESDWDEVSTEKNNNSNNYYQDNCNYLNNRYYNQRNLSTLHAGQIYNHNSDKDDKHNYRNIHSEQCNDNINNLTHLQQRPSNNLNKNYKKRNGRKGYNQLLPRLGSRTTTSSPSGTKSSQYSDSIFVPVDSDYEAHLLDFPLLGDDFLLYLARMELKCKFKKDYRVLQSGMCVSGQSITAAIRRVQRMAYCEKNVIVNVGSVDIMKGKPLVQIEHEYRELIALMHRKGMTPIMTTLAPLANYGHEEEIKEKLERFNAYIRRLSISLKVIDVWKCLVNERGHTRFDCFQNEPRSVTGTFEPYVFWNKIGRQRVLQLIEANIEY